MAIVTATVATASAATTNVVRDFINRSFDRKITSGANTTLLGKFRRRRDHPIARPITTV